MTLQLLCVVVVMVLVTSCMGEVDRQKWSQFTKMGRMVEMECQDDLNVTKVLVGHRMAWKKKGHPNTIVDDAVYSLSLSNMALNFRASESTNGIYFCEVHDGARLVGVIVKGVNVGVHEYDDFLDKYERDLIVGVISAASVLFLVVSLGMINHFRYQSDEQRAKQRMRREERMRRLEASHNGHDNKAMSLEERAAGKRGYDVAYPRGGDNDNIMKTSF